MILGIYGNSDSGKTGLVERILEFIKLEKYTVCMIKHSQESFETENKDTWRFKKAGADNVLLTGKDGVVYFTDDDLKDLIELIQKIKKFELILIEGYKKESWLNKIKIGDCEEEKNTIMTYTKDEEIFDYILRNVETEKIRNRLSGRDCGDCGYLSCNEFAEKIYKKEENVNGCKHLKKNRVELKINDETVDLGKFPEEIINNIILAFIKSIKTEKEPEKININIDIK